MSEIGELIAAPRAHTRSSTKCPFCPPKARKEYKTYPGQANDSTVLEAVMRKPESLTQKQAGARPQTAAEEDGKIIEQSKPTKREPSEATSYTFQAHHLISGKQALHGHAIEKWIKKSGKNKKDTGYSVNCTGNGFWAPSVPREYVGRWGPGKGLTNQQRQVLAEKVMAAANAQVHIGPHNIHDPDDPLGDKHQSYDKYLKEQLTLICNRVDVWAKKCGCEEDQNKWPKQATHQLHNTLDSLSDHMQRMVEGHRSTWKVFLSKYALVYHAPVCTHGGRRKKKSRTTPGS